MRRIPWQALELHTRVRNRLVTAAARAVVGELGAGSVLQSPIKLHGADRIRIGADVQVGRGSWLEVIGDEGRLEVGDGARITGFLFVSAVERVVIEEDVLIAQYVHIADHSHARSLRGVPIRRQGVTDIAPVRIGRGAWLGQGAVVLPGADIGENAVIGANSVVRGVVPDGSTAVGAPARVVRSA